MRIMFITCLAVPFELVKFKDDTDMLFYRPGTGLCAFSLAMRTSGTLRTEVLMLKDHTHH